jgi:hypothetical protein
MYMRGFISLSRFFVRGLLRNHQRLTNFQACGRDARIRLGDSFPLLAVAVGFFRNAIERFAVLDDMGVAGAGGAGDGRIRHHGLNGRRLEGSGLIRRRCGFNGSNVSHIVSDRTRLRRFRSTIALASCRGCRTSDGNPFKPSEISCHSQLLVNNSSSVVPLRKTIGRGC